MGRDADLGLIEWSGNMIFFFALHYEMGTLVY